MIIRSPTYGPENLQSVMQKDFCNSIDWPRSVVDAVDGSSTGTGGATNGLLLRPHHTEEPIMQAITTIGLDIAKSVFQVHGS
jgi:hypothetical protein